jgi:arylsulfatase A-like enzyme
MLTRRNFLASAAAAPLLQGQAARRPNILFIFSDDHAYQAISAYGSNRNQTPNIDRIGREGMRFDQCLVTNSICGPSRATILTGKYSHKNGFIDNRSKFDGSQQTFPKLFQKAGYQTAIFGKWHLVTEPTGFDAWEVLPGQGSYYNPDFLRPAGRHRREGYATDIITDLSLDWLRNGRDRSKPFVLMAQHKAPHRNWMPAPEKLHLYEGQTIPEPSTLFDDYEHRASPAHKQAMTIARHMGDVYDLKLDGNTTGGRAAGGGDVPNNPELDRMTPQQRRIWDAAYRSRNEEFRKLNLSGKELTRYKYQRYIKDYLRCISSVDDSVGRLLSHLDAEGLADNTLVIYCSDQGFYLGEHGWYDKRWIYEESLRTPMLARLPGMIAPGSVDRHLVSNLDFAETFLELAGVPVPGDMQGRSLVPIFRGQSPANWRSSHYYHYYETGVHDVAPHEGVRTDKFTLAHYYTTGEWELFDNQKDPQQVRSRFGDAGYAAVTKELQGELARLRTRYEVPENAAPKA